MSRFFYHFSYLLWVSQLLYSKNMNLGGRVRERREELGISQEDLAKAVGVSQVAITNLERRDSKSSRNITTLAQALSCSIDWLTTGENKNDNKDQLKKHAQELMSGLSENEIKELTDYKRFILSKRQ